MVFDYATPAALAAFLRTELLQDGDGGPADVLTELDRFEELAASLDIEQIRSSRITSRLQALVGRLTDLQGTGEMVRDQLESARRTTSSPSSTENSAWPDRAPEHVADTFIKRTR